MVSVSYVMQDNSVILRQIRYDLRGYGLSDKPVTSDAYETHRLAEDWAAVVGGFNVTKPIVIGWYVYVVWSISTSMSES